ncbi:MAG: hypothetical protein EOP09_08420 [Proteobacteria bacterium]|nr:MAG: hypothetical protein EOP09_08420 [Pseudomonadota bacterium]
MQKQAVRRAEGKEIQKTFALLIDSPNNSEADVIKATDMGSFRVADLKLQQITLLPLVREKSTFLQISLDELTKAVATFDQLKLDMFVESEPIKAARKSLVTARESAETAAINSGKSPNVPDGPGGMTWDSLTFAVGYSKDQIKVLDPDATFADQITSNDVKGRTFRATYNAHFDGRLPSAVGLSLISEPQYNKSSLKEVNVEDQTTSTDGSTTRIISTSRKAFQGNFASSRGLSVNTDWILYPRKFSANVGVNLFTRYRTSGDHFFTPGIGLFRFKEKTPSSPTFGFTLRRDDDKSGARFDLVTGIGF